MVLPCNGLLRSFTQGLLLLLLIVPSLLRQGISAAEGSVDVEARMLSYSDDALPVAEFQHLAFDNKTLYIGGTNALYQLDARTLQLRFRLVTGPQLDSPFCNEKGDCLQTPVGQRTPPKSAPAQRLSDYQSDEASLPLIASRPRNASMGQKQLTDNVNKILLIYKAKNLIISCGSLFQGICSLYRLGNLSESVVSLSSLAVPVASNSANASTVAFLSPPALKDSSADDASTTVSDDADSVLYVGSTFTYDAYRDQFPAVASRSLASESMFRLYFPGDVSGQSSMIVQTEFRSDFRISYVGGFFSEDFAYWATVQRTNPVEQSAPFVSKLARVCARDSRYETYAEIPLECLGRDNSKYNLLQAIYVGKVGSSLLQTLPITAKGFRQDEVEFLFGVFAKGQQSTKPQTQSAVCVFSTKEIRAAFQFTIERCNNEIGYLNLPHFGYRGRCVRAYDKISEDFCDHARVGGDIPLTHLAFATFENTLLTSVAVDVVGEHTVAFLGTRQGSLKKLLVTSKSESKEIAELTVFPNNAIRSSMLFDTSNEYLYAMAKNKVFKIPTENCAIHNDCATCLQSQDPYCGWCTLQQKCSTNAQCADSAAPNRWQAVGSGECPSILELNPTNASVLALLDSAVTLKFNFLPRHNSSSNFYQCVFNHSYIPALLIGPSTLKCNLPQTNSRPKIVAADADHVSIPLKVRSSETGAVVFETRFVFYDCTQHKLCTSCVQSRWLCDWCVQENSCVYDGGLCRNQTVDHNSPALTCPHISLPAASDVVIPSGQSSSISLPVENLSRMSASNNAAIAEFACLLEIASEGKLFRTKAHVKRDGKTIDCEPFVYSYDTPVPQMVADFQIQLNQGQVVDKIEVKLYKCELLATDCSQCFTLNTQYLCTWCAGSCRYQEFCPVGSVDVGLETAKTVCPAPLIDLATPLVGPKEGGTLITIRGHDLGTHRSDVEDRVFIAGVPCRVVDYEVSTRMQCVIERSSEVKSGHVEVVVLGTKKAIYGREFRFVDPSVYSFEPSIGPKSGGTKIRINGAHLASASQIKVFLGDLPCNIDRETISDRSLQCVTSPAPRPNLSMGGITISLDAANRSLEKSFTYAEDPTVSVIEPMESFASGGRQLAIRGNYLDVIQVPSIYFISLFNGDILSEPTPCQVLNRTLMHCPSPTLSEKTAKSLRAARDVDDSSSDDSSLSSNTRWHLPIVAADDLTTAMLSDNVNAPQMENEKPDLSKYERLGVGFVMDAVASLRNLSSQFQIVVTPDPEYYKFAGGRKIHRGDMLILEGRNLNLATRASEVKIYVGQEPCAVTLLAKTQLVCTPPLRKPRAVNLDGDYTPISQPLVTVKVGNLKFEIGYLDYDAPFGGMNPALVGGVIATAAFLLLVGIVCICVWWRRKSAKAEKEYKRIQLQMDTLESNVRNECKQAFAELQTDMSDLQADLMNKTGIPFHTRRIYASKVLFRDDHSVMLEWQHCSTNGRTNHMQEALMQFECLLRNRQFVATFVDALERQPSFTAQDRVYVASLLMAALARNMQYCTDVVLQLLNSLIEKSVEGRCPQLMLRRTESVVEKMLANWIALCLYDYLHEYAGESLFVLFKALKHQVEKGPVDAVTGDARYSLSEDRLLKEQLQPEPVLIHIIPPSEADPDDKLFCRVLNCDTVCQTKAKILDTLYKHAPHSSRPSVYDVDLEWRHSPSGHVVLQDDDRTSPQSKDGWRRLNTLEHYGVCGQAIMALIPKNRNVFASSNCSNNTYATISIASSTLLLRHSPENTERGVRYWHLVKPDDSGCGRAASVIPEIYLTRLLATKGTLQKFVDDFFRTALSPSSRFFPPVIKFLFDHLETQAQRLNVTEPSVIYSWKNNSLPLRFWVNIIKNPDFIFDVEKSSTVDSCLSVIAQTFMDSCSTADHRLGKDSPSNKLLFAKDLYKYRHLVSEFYASIHSMPSISEQELNAYMTHLSKAYAQEFNVYGAVRELMSFAVKYSEEILEALDDCLPAQRQGLSAKLNSVFNITIANQNSRSSSRHHSP